MEYNELCVGIDLGTTNSVVGTCRLTDGVLHTPIKKVSRVIDSAASTGKMIRRNDELLPSYVFYHDTKDGKYDVYVGDYAKKQYISRPYLVAKSIKSQMGQAKVEGMQEGIPDKTPEEVSARIIRHLLNDLEDYYGEKITDAVITIPANFDIAMREATLRAAEMAGINVRNEDGSLNDREILLSEPEAVMYDLINQIQKGMYDIIIDFTEKRKILVFDIGGGTLDVTLHEVAKNAENPNIYNIEAIASNRYSRVAGDTFDAKVANTMYEKYIKYYERQSPEIARRIKTNEKHVLANFMNYAEELKIEIGNAYAEFKARGRILSGDREFEYGGIMTNGYSSQDIMTKDEFEECIEPLLGFNYKYSDYKKFDSITDSENIIYPVLDVLKKAAKKLNADDLKIDAVVLNGGMSRLYLIKKRLDEFFGLNTIAISDPDKSVAQGAAVYHYYLHKDASLLSKLRERKNQEETIGIEPANDNISNAAGIISTGRVLNESIYLGLDGGTSRLLVSDGEKLPYVSEVITGFSIKRGQNKARVPVGYKVNGRYVTVASGDIVFKRTYKIDTPISIQFALSLNQILSFEAWTSSDREGKKILEKGKVTLAFGQIEANSSRTRILPPKGSTLVPVNELASIKDLCKQHDSLVRAGRGALRKKTIEGNLRRRKENIEACGNPQDFAPNIIELFKSGLNESWSFCYNMVSSARKLSKYWNDNEKLELANICLSILNRKNYLINDTSWIGIYSEAIKTIGCCGSGEQVQKLNAWTEDARYKDALLYAFAHARFNSEWVYEQLSLNRASFAVSVWALGMSVRRNGAYNENPSKGEHDEHKAVNIIIDKIEAGNLSQSELASAVTALGMICDQRVSATDSVSTNLVGDARRIVQNIQQLNEHWESARLDKACSVAIQMMDGKTLDEDDAQYLLNLMNFDFGRASVTAS